MESSTVAEKLRFVQRVMTYWSHDTCREYIAIVHGIYEHGGSGLVISASRINDLGSFAYVAIHLLYLNVKRFDC